MVKWTKLSLMKRKLVAAAIAGFFSFILITTAWDYCHPDPDTLLIKGNSVSQDQQIKKPHHPCASLKDAYDVLTVFKVDSGNSQHDFKDIASDLSVGSFEANPSDFHGLSPPFESLSFQNLPIFLLYRNLRL